MLVEARECPEHGREYRVREGTFTPNEPEVVYEAETHGPSSVVTDKYRAGWDQIFGPRGQA